MPHTQRLWLRPTPAWAAIVRWDPAGSGAPDGGSDASFGGLQVYPTVAVIEAYSALNDAGLDVSQWNMYEPAGTRSLLLPDGERQTLEADGGLRCEVVTFEASTWPAALTSGTCAPRVKAAGIGPYPCHDFCGCSTAGAAIPGFVVALLLWRRRRPTSPAR